MSDVEKTDDLVLLELSNGIATITLNRPERLNAVNVEMFTKFIAVLRAIGDDSDIGIVVLTGAGTSFCTGKDLKGESRSSWSASQKMQASRLTFSVVPLMREIPQPIIAAVRGHAVGAGFALAAASDMRVVAPDAQFNPVFTKIGMTPGDLGLSWLLPRIIGAGRAAQVFYRAEVIDAETALDWGLVNEISEDPFARARGIAEELGRGSAESLRQTKELLSASWATASLRDHTALELRSQVICGDSAEHAAAMEAFKTRK